MKTKKARTKKPAAHLNKHTERLQESTDAGPSCPRCGMVHSAAHFEGVSGSHRCSNCGQRFDIDEARPTAIHKPAPRPAPKVEEAKVSR